MEFAVYISNAYLVPLSFFRVICGKSGECELCLKLINLFDFFVSKFLENNPDHELASYKELCIILKCSVVCEMLWNRNSLYDANFKKELIKSCKLSSLCGNYSENLSLQHIQKDKFLPLLHIFSYQLKLFNEASIEELKFHINVIIWTNLIKYSNFSIRNLIKLKVGVLVCIILLQHHQWNLHLHFQSWQYFHFSFYLKSYSILLLK